MQRETAELFLHDPLVMPRKSRSASTQATQATDVTPGASARPRHSPVSQAAERPRPSALLDTRVIYCGDNLDQLQKLPDGCVDLVYIDSPAWPKPLRRGEGPPFNSNRDYEVFWGETKEKRAFEDRHASTQAYIEYIRPRCVELARVLKLTGSFCLQCDELGL